MLIELDLDGDVQLRRELLRWKGAVTDASLAFDSIIMGGSRDFMGLRKLEGRQFATQGGFASGGWAPLAPSTVKAKARAGLDPRILHATGRLAASLNGPGRGHIEIVNAHQFIFGTSVPYARFHQLGKRLKRRRPIELRDRDRRAMVNVLQRHLRGELG